MFDGLGVEDLLAKGLGVPQDDAEAVRWYRKSAEQGVAKAQFFLGLMYTLGRGVPQDYAEAYMWYNLAATQGHKHAAKNRDRIAKTMAPADVSKAQKLAREWMAKFEARKKP